MRVLKSSLMALAPTLAFAWVLALSLPVMAHGTGNARRKPGQCKTIKKPKKRAACVACVKRPKQHHFHPGKAQGKRCRPNNGKP